MDYLERAIFNFNQKKITAKNSGAKSCVSYGKWNDSWNVNNVFLNALKYYLINNILNK